MSDWAYQSTVVEGLRQFFRGRKLTVRHLVRGHWRHQYHPSDGSRRPRYIAPYIKGPKGAPLRATEHVMVWRR